MVFTKTVVDVLVGMELGKRSIGYDHFIVEFVKLGMS